MGDLDTDGTPHPMCPYCGYEQCDAWEIPDASGEEECQRCGRRFRYERHEHVTWTTGPLEDRCAP